MSWFHIFLIFFEFCILISNLVKLRPNSGLTKIWTSLKHENEKLCLDLSYLLQNEAISKVLFHFMIQSSNPSLQPLTSYDRVGDITFLTWFFCFMLSTPCLSFYMVSIWHKKTMWAGFTFFWFFLILYPHFKFGQT